MGRAVQIFTITIWNRADCCQNRLPSFMIWAGNVSYTVPFTAATSIFYWNPNLLCASGSPTADWLAGRTPSFTVACNANARYVTLQRTDGGALINLCQLEITGAIAGC